MSIAGSRTGGNDLTTVDVALVRDSYRTALRDRRDFAELFYDKLFHDHPFVRALFTDDREKQAAALIATLNVVVLGLHDLPPMLSMIGDLARRHVRYGVRESHYPIVGTALIDTFAQTLGERFTPEVRAAWTAAYAVLATAMIAAAYPKNSCPAA